MLRCTTDDLARSWLLAPTAGRGPDGVPGPAQAADLQVTTDPETLLLLLWRRWSLDEVAGRVDAAPAGAAALRALLAGPVTA